MIRKATSNDIDTIETIYNKLHTNEEKGLVTIGWNRSIYPTRATALEALENEIPVLKDKDIREPLFDFLEEHYGKIRILWRPELHSIQQKYHLPEYKQKSKAFVQKKLVEKLPEMILNEQISQELFERDYTQIAEEIRDYKKENSRVRRRRK